jgi:hypothetical protein
MSRDETNKNYSCQKTREILDDFMESLVDMRMGGHPSGHSSENSEMHGVLDEPFMLDKSVEEHLQACAECLNYKLANATLLASASALPAPSFDEGLTRDIMESVKEISLEAPQKGKAILALLASFALFAICLPLEAGDNIWSILSWTLALGAVLSLEPVLRPRGTDRGIDRMKGANSYA